MSGIFKTQHSLYTHHVPGSPVIDPELQRGLDIHPGQVTAHPQPLAAGQPADRHTGDLGRDPGRLWGDYHHYYGSRTHDLKRWTLLPRGSIGNAAVTIFWPCVPEERRDENCSGQQNFRDHSGSGSVSDHIGTIQLTLLSRWGRLKRCLHQIGYFYVHTFLGKGLIVKSNSWVLSGLQLSWNFL